MKKEKGSTIILGKFTMPQVVATSVAAIVVVVITVTIAVLQVKRSKETINNNVLSETNVQEQIQTLSSDEQSEQYEKEWKQAYIDFISDNKIYYDDEIQKKYINLRNIYLYDVDLDGEVELIVCGEYIGYATGGNSGDDTFIFKYKDKKVELIKTVRGFFGILDGKYLVTSVVGSDGVPSLVDTVFYKIGDLEVDNSIKMDCKGYNPTICSFYVDDKLVSSNDLQYVMENMTLSSTTSYKVEEVSNGGIEAISYGEYNTTSILKAGSGKEVEQTAIDAYKESLMMKDEAKEYITNYCDEASATIYFLDENPELFDLSNDDMTTQVKPETIFSEFQNAIVIGSDLNVRRGPGINYDSIMKITTDDKFEICGSENGWYYGKTANGIYGWVIQDYVSVNDNLESKASYQEALAAFAKYLDNQSNYGINGGNKAISKSSQILFHDYNEDSIPELVVKNGYNYAVFAYIENSVVNIYSFYANDVVVMCDDGISWYSLGSDMHHDGLFIYNGETQVLEYTGDADSTTFEWHCNLNGDAISVEEYNTTKQNLEAKEMKECFNFKIAEIDLAIEAYKNTR